MRQISVGCAWLHNPLVSLSCDLRDEFVVSVVCLVLPVGETLVGDPIGEYTDMNQPDLAENPVASIRVTASDIVYKLDTGEEVRNSREEDPLSGRAHSGSRRCGRSRPGSVSPSTTLCSWRPAVPCPTVIFPASR